MTPDAALKELAALGDSWRAAKAAFDEIDSQVKAAIVKARRIGATPTDTEAASPLSPATTRKVSRAYGVEPGRPGGRPSPVDDEPRQPGTTEKTSTPSPS